MLCLSFSRAWRRRLSPSPVNAWREGLIRVVIFVAYLLLVAALATSRTFQYHGAEHTSRSALEHEDPLTSRVCEVPRAPTLRHGFLVIFIILSILMLACFRTEHLGQHPGPRLLVPVIACWRMGSFVWAPTAMLVDPLAVLPGSGFEFPPSNPTTA